MQHLLRSATAFDLQKQERIQDCASRLYGRGSIAEEALIALDALSADERVAVVDTVLAELHGKHNLLKEDQIVPTTGNDS